MKKLLKAASLGLALFTLLANMNISAFAEMTEPYETEETGTIPSYSAAFSLTNNMRSVIITPSVDFYTSPEDDEAAVSVQLDTVYQNAVDIGLNTVFIRTVADDCSYYSTDMNKIGENDYISLAISKADTYGLDVFLIYNIDYVLSECGNISDATDTLISETHRFALKYKADGIILDDYYSQRSGESFGNYMAVGSGIGYENWLYDSTEYFFRTACDVIHATDNSIAVGLMVNDMWANSTSNEAGSETADSTQALYDGFADTKSFVEKGYVDFTVVKSYGSLTDGNLPFEKVTGWWGTLSADSSIPMYVVHYNEKIGTSSTGWGGEDQLLRQLSTAKDITGYGGSVFNSYASLTANPLNSTTTLTQFYSNQINEETLFEDLVMTSPSRLKYTTEEPVAEFMGSFDENFDVYFNGSKIELNKAGNFYLEKDLAIGNNKFTITHKGKTYTYNIERKITVMKSVDDSIGEGKTLKVEGGTKIQLSAIAYKGATVTASINGKVITLKQTSTTLDNDDLNSYYARFKGTYTVPDGIIGEEQNLGMITVVGTYKGYTMTMYGSKVKVNALPEPPKEEITAEIYDQDSAGSGEVVGTIDPIKTESEAVTFVKALNNYTFVYNAKTTGAVLTPDFGQLPAGTLDYYLSTSGSYYITESGKRFNSSDVTLAEGFGLGDNKLFVRSVGTSGGDSYIKIQLDDKVSYNVETIGNTYYTAYDGDYNVDNFTADYVYITFDNVTSVTKLPSFEYNLVFSSGKWETVTVNGVPKFRLVLKLRQPGVYMGSGAYYDSEGCLILTFQVPTNVISNLNIVIDPGHGYGVSADKFDPGAIGHVTEQKVNLAVAKSLTSKLKDMGVNAVRLKTESTFLLTASRPSYARQYGCDLYISLHSNKVTTNSEARGVEVYYFTPYSQPLAAAISAEIANYFQNNVYSDGANKNRGAKYSYYWVTEQQDFPSVLVEMGFVSNLEDAMALADSDHQAGIAKAIINGINTYLSRSSISYSTNGNDSAGEGGGEVTTSPAETEAPEDSSEPEETTTTPGTTDENDAIPDDESQETIGSDDDEVPEEGEEIPEDEDGEEIPADEEEAIEEEEPPIE